MSDSRPPNEQPDPNNDDAREPTSDFGQWLQWYEQGLVETDPAAANAHSNPRDPWQARLTHKAMQTACVVADRVPDALVPISAIVGLMALGLRCLTRSSIDLGALLLTGFIAMLIVVMVWIVQCSGRVHRRRHGQASTRQQKDASELRAQRQDQANT